MTMEVLVACEFSQVVTKAFIKWGHNAMSCDFLPGEKGLPHYQGNVLDILNDGWDLMIAHPPCTYLCNSGVRWLYEQDDRAGKMVYAANFFKILLNASINHICIENPIPHKYSIEIISKKYNQIIQPWQFGHTTSKATCLWLKNLSPLQPTNIIPKEQRTQDIWKMSPGPDRAKERSRTFQGIADAMAEQWG